MKTNSTLILIPNPEEGERESNVLRFQLKPKEEKFMLFKEENKNSQFSSSTLKYGET